MFNKATRKTATIRKWNEYLTLKIGSLDRCCSIDKEI